ncbi:hypothetical protein E3N88_23598 [Mikania micrantha]|uniref:Reverse transcriptase/retrotransposon-derived protein RNase H-like domain-containing protein n=1 Tax=Mikania micrantha TaxID=192012 RepID=A0A5N6NFQ8_9ASTR|nr:hypothetical protein E3N88_23598 [Mikania micrantha]
MVIKIAIGEIDIHWVYLDGGSASKIMYEHCFNQLEEGIKKKLKTSYTPLIGFAGEKTLKSYGTTFQWTEEAEIAFQDMKWYIASMPSLVAPMMPKQMSLYIAIGQEAISSVLVVERSGTQLPVYFLSRVLWEAETRYPEVEKAVLVIVHTARGLRRIISQHNQMARPQNRPSRMTKWHDGRMSRIKVNLRDTNKGKGEGTFNESQAFGPKDKRQTSRQKVM